MSDLIEIRHMTKNSASMQFRQWTEQELPPADGLGNVFDESQQQAFGCKQVADDLRQKQSDGKNPVTLPWEDDSALDDKQEQEEPNSDNSFNAPQNLRYHGYDYIQVCRGRRSCLYRQTLEGKTIAFEVFVIHIQSETTLYGKLYPAHEHWPKDEDFGKTAWSCMTLDVAMKRFKELEKL